MKKSASILLLLLCCNPLLLKTQDNLESLFRNSYSVFEVLRNNKGIYRDAKLFSGTDFHPASVASIGMGLISLCIADEMGWINDAEAKVISTLESMAGENPSYRPDRNASGYFRHWIDMNTGLRAWDSEYSTIDSGILLCGALFCQRYFCENERINELANNLWQSIDWTKAIEDPTSGGIYLEMLANGEGSPNSITLPFNEYMIVAWLAMNQEKEKGITGNASSLWENHYADPSNLPGIFYDGIALLTDAPNRYLSSFVFQFPYYLCNYFTSSEAYLQVLRNAREADREWWSRQAQANEDQWGLGAGSANTGSGYEASAINNNNSRIYSPHIIGGFLPIAPEDTTHLLNLFNNQQGLYTLPNTFNNKILWRKSLNFVSWSAPEVQGVDYSTMVFGLASLPRFLGPDFFKRNNDFFGTPCNQITSSQEALQKDMDIKIYPNPAKDDFYLELGKYVEKVLQIRIVDLQGKTIYRRESIQKTQKIKLSGFPKGLYILQIVQENHTFSKKIVLK